MDVDTLLRWTKDDVKEWLLKTAGEDDETVRKFAEAEVTGASLPELDDAIMREMVSIIFPRRVRAFHLS